MFSRDWRNARMPLSAGSSVEAARFHAYGARHLDETAERYGIPADVRETVRLISMVLVDERSRNDQGRLPTDARAEDGARVEEELLIEEFSIDGICGVY